MTINKEMHDNPTKSDFPRLFRIRVPKLHFKVSDNDKSIGYLRIYIPEHIDTILAILVFCGTKIVENAIFVAGSLLLIENVNICSRFINNCVNHCKIKVIISRLFVYKYGVHVLFISHCETQFANYDI